MPRRLMLLFVIVGMLLLSAAPPALAQSDDPEWTWPVWTPTIEGYSWCTVDEAPWLTESYLVERRGSGYRIEFYWGRPVPVHAQPVRTVVWSETPEGDSSTETVHRRKRQANAVCKAWEYDYDQLGRRWETGIDVYLHLPPRQLRKLTSIGPE